MSNYAHRGIVNESTRRRLPRGPVDFMAVNNSKRRNRLSTYWLQLNTLWDKRTGDENRLLFNFLLAFRSLLNVGVGEHRSGKQAGRDEDCSAFRYRHLHKTNLRPGMRSAQIIETTMDRSQEQERQ